MATDQDWGREWSATDVNQRRRTAEKLAQMGEGARRFAVKLIHAVTDSDELVREWVVSALEGAGPPEPEQIPDLCTLLQSSQTDVAYWAATLLGRLGSSGWASSGSPATASLIQALGVHPEDSAGERIVWALGMLADPAAIPTLQETSHSSQPRLARLARESLERLNSP